jgi:autotransporter-associated beta strand protein
MRAFPHFWLDNLQEVAFTVCPDVTEMRPRFSPPLFSRPLLAALLLLLPIIVRANIPGGTTGSGAPVSVKLNPAATSGTMSNGIVQLIFSTSGAVINQINYTYNNGSGTVTKQLLLDGKDGGEFYWEFGGFGGNWTASVVSSGTYGELAFTSLATGTAATGDLQVNFSMLPGSPGFYVTLTMTHHTGDIATGLGEMRTNIYLAPDFNWMSVSPVIQRELGIGSTFVPAFDSPQENSLCVSGVNQGLYDDKYKFSALFGTERVWGWSAVQDPTHGVAAGPNAGIGIWDILASSEYYNGGPLKPELMDAPFVNMLNGGHYYMGSDSNWGANEQWQRVQGPYFVYINNISPSVTDPIQASQALYNDAVAQAAAEATAWPYPWFNNPANGNTAVDQYYATAAQRGTVTGQIVVSDTGNPNASGSNMWVGVIQQPYSPDNVFDFQEWYKAYQFWTKTDVNGNFTIPAVISGTGYTLWAFGPGAEGTFLSQNQNGGNPPLLYNLPATPFSVTVNSGSTTSLGTVTWTPTRVGPTVFEIGYPDRTGHKFRHGDDWWIGDIGPTPTEPSPIWTKFYELPNDFPNGLTYTVGTNQWPTDWYFIQPILVSTTGGNNDSSSNIQFYLPAGTNTGGTASLYLGVASDYYGAVEVIVNGTNLDSENNSGVTANPNPLPTSGYIPPYTQSDTSIREGCNAAASDERINFPASLLHTGATVNTITLSLRQIGGSYFADHFMYDYIRLELTGYLPPPPASVSAYSGDNSVLVTWPVTPGATSYMVLRSVTSGGGYSSVASGVVGPVCGSGLSNATYVDTTAANGTTYYYVVESVNPTGASANSPQSAGVTPSASAPATAPGAPTGLAATSASSAVTVTWNASSGANYYTLLRSTVIDKIPNYSPTPLITSTTTILSTITLSNSITGLSYVDSAVTKGTKYAYTVEASNAAGTSGTSNTMIAKPVPATSPGDPEVTVVPGNDQVTLNWNAVPGAVGYIIEYATSSGGPYTYLSSVSDLTYTLTGLNPNTTYYFEVQTMNETGASSFVSSPGTTAPAAPATVTATAGDTQVQLGWKASAAATGYVVERGTTSGGPYTTIATPTGLSYTDSGLINGITYYYVVAASNSSGPGPVSTQASATPSSALPVAPMNLIANGQNSQIELGWNASAGATGYNLMRASASGGPYSTIKPGLTTTSSTDASVLSGTTYYYVVTATNASGASAYSNQASASLGGGVSTLTWAGTSSSAWDYATANWITSGGGASDYVDGVNVLFSDGANTGTVSIAAAVSPAAVSFSNSVLGYVMNSTSTGISGTAAITKMGSAQVTWTGSNSYSGGTLIEGGTYALGADSSTNAGTIESPGLTGGTNATLGPNSVLVNNGGELRFGGHGGAIETYIIPNGITVNGGSIYSIDGVQTLIGGLTIGSGGASLLTTRSTKNLAVNSGFNGTGNITIDDVQTTGNTSGGLVLVQSASNPYDGTITLNAPSTGYLGGIIESGTDTSLINATIIDDNTSVDGLVFGTANPQIGAIGGGGNITMPSGTLTTGGDGASTTYSGIFSGPGGLTKAGPGTMILTNTNTYSGATIVTGGVLEIIGGITNSTSAGVASGAVLYLNGGTLSIAGPITNSGILKLSGSASLSQTGAFTNNGVLDLINGPQTLPSNFTNAGTVLYASSVQVQQLAMSSTNNFSLTIQGYAQHTYQLQRATSLIAPITWTNVGAAQVGTGGPLNFTDSSAPNTAGFYKILVSP